MASVIDRAKAIPASTIAAQQGIILKRHGVRLWACCPFHPDQQPSLLFYPDGGWHCFSCGAGGDSVALLASLMDTSQLEAARMICADYQPPAAVARKIMNPYEWKAQRQKALQGTIKQADEYTGKFTAQDAEKAWADPLFKAAVLAKAQARCMIDALDTADDFELEQLMLQEGGARRSG